MVMAKVLVQLFLEQCNVGGGGGLTIIFGIILD